MSNSTQNGRTEPRPFPCQPVTSSCLTATLFTTRVPTNRRSAAVQSCSAIRSPMLPRSDSAPVATDIHGWGLGGGLSPRLKAAEDERAIEKRHLIVNRILRERALDSGVSYYDLGTDYHYPFFDGFGPTSAALAAAAQHRESALHYPSSYGLVPLRDQVSQFLNHRYGVHLNAHEHLMVTSGASQVFDALSRAFVGPTVLVPELSLPTVRTIARGNGAEVHRLPCDSSGFPTLVETERLIRSTGPVRFLYLNSPCNPTG